LFALLTIFPGCSEIRQYAEIARDGRISEEYLDVLKQWTAEKTVYSEFETRARIVATERSAEFNEAYRKEYDRIHLSSPGEVQARQALDSGAFLEYFFYAYVPEGKWNDFARGDSVWKVFLVTGKDTAVSPVDLREITRITPAVREFFPYITPHGKFYSVRFPALAADGTPTPRTLVFTSALGEIRLRWPKS
jgi:hypothetical protein